MSIIVTLMVFDLKLPAGPWANVPAEFARLAPHGIAFVASFLIVVTFWLHHHQMLVVTTHCRRSLLWYNNVLLLTLSFIPFVTAFLGDYPLMPLSGALYGVVLGLAGASGALMFRHVAARGMLDPRIPKERCRMILRRYRLAPLSYFVGAGVAFLPHCIWVSYVIYVAILVAFMVPEPLILEEKES